MIFLRTGLATFKPSARAGGEGTLLALVVADLDERHAHFVRAGATVVTPPETEPWGERVCQDEDPNGFIVLSNSSSGYDTPLN